MSRYHSIYATQERPSRWPWLVVLLLALALAGAGAAVAAGAATAPVDRLLEAARLRDEKPPPAAGSVAVDPTAAATEPAATAEPTGDPAASQQLALDQPESAPGVAASPTGTQVELADAGSPAEVVETYLARWSAGDYDGLYDLLSSETQAAISRQDFVDRYAAIRDEAGLTAVAATATGGPNLDGQVPIRVEMTSSKVDPIVEENAIQLRKEGDDWRVAWTPSAIFRSLGDGCVDFIAAPVQRGSILDRNGEPLAYDGSVDVLGIIPGQIANEQEMLAALSKLIGMPAEEIKERYQDGQPDWFMPIQEFPKDQEERIADGIRDLDGVALRAQSARIYPLGARAAHITGYVTKVTGEDMAADETGTLAEGDWLGRAGLEAGANDLLAGTPGGRLAVVECEGRAERALIAERAAVPPRDIVLTIDKDFQIAVDKALGKVRGSAVVIDPRTGAVLAMASHPSFDPNWFVLGFSKQDLAFVNDEAERPLLNRATGAAYPTGSIFKVITMAAGMEGLDYSGETEIDCPQEWKIPGTNEVRRDWTYEEGTGAQGVLTLHNALVNSCNTVFYQIGNDLDAKDEALLPEMTRAFGLGAPTGIPYLAEIAGIVPDAAWKQENLDDYWARGDAVNLAIGQGYLEATPLQMANAYAAIANGGTLYRPFIVEFTQTEDGERERVGARKRIRKLPLDRDNVREIQSALRDQTSNTFGAGSARVFGDFDWPIAGKTGTAQNEATRGKKPHSWFAAFGPHGDKATIASIVMVESVGEGVQYAAPRTRDIVEAYLKTDLADVTGDTG